MYIVDNIISATDNGKIIVLVLLDYFKAFDMAGHSTLLGLLKLIDLENATINLIAGYLHSSSQKVFLDGVFQVY